jgi:hypothetical protein
MKRVALIGVLLTLCIVGYAIAYPSVSLRYRLKYEVDINGRTIESSGVVEIIYSKVVQILGVSRELSIDVAGEALAIDIGTGDVVFSLLREGSSRRSGPECIVPLAFRFPYGAIGVSDFRRLSALSGQVSLEPSQFPLLVRFGDVSDPMTVERVGPLDIGKELGAPSATVRATIEVVGASFWPFSLIKLSGDPITRGLDQRLKWLPALKGRFLNGSSISRGAPLGLSSSDFSRGK